MTDDLLLSRHQTGWLARFALRVDSAVNLTRLAGYHDLTTEQRYHRARAEDIAYLTRLSTVESGAAFEFRWLTGDPVTLLVLGRVVRETREAAEISASRARAELATLPAHVHWEAITGADEIQHAFVPFRVHQHGIAETRRPCVLATPQRPDAGVTTYLAVPPLQSLPHEWPAILNELARAAPGTMLSIGLEPITIGPEFATMLSSIADRYAHLTRPTQANPGAGLYSRPTWLPADPFALYAEPLYRDAANRYRRNLFRLRVTVATDHPLTPHLPESVAALLSAPDPPCTIETPTTPMDLGLLMESIATLGVPTWGGHPVWHTQPRSLRLLTELADPHEAAAASWLPASTTGTLPAFPTTDPDPSAQPTTRGVHIHDSVVDITGDVIAGNKHEWRD